MTFHYITGVGQRDTRKHSGGEYQTGTMQDLFAMLANPIAATKGAGPWAIFTDTNGHLGRERDFQVSNGAATCLWVDIDVGDPTIDQVVEATRRAIGAGYAFAVYTSRSNGEVRADGTVKSKMRVILPLAQWIRGHDYKAFAAALNQAMQHQGVIPDEVTLTMTQLCYLPSYDVDHPERYAYHIEDGVTFDAVASHLLPLAQELTKLHQQEAEARKARQAEFANKGKSEGPASPIAAYRRKHPTTPEMMEWLGFSTTDGDNWKMEGGSNYSTELFEDGALYTLSSTVGNLGGRQAGQGWYFQDTYNLYAHKMYHGDMDRMYEYAVAVRNEELANDPLVKAGFAMWDRMVETRNAHQKSPDSLPAPPEPEYVEPVAEPLAPALTGDVIPPAPPGSATGKSFVNLPMPAGFVGEVAQWIYHHQMFDPQWDIAITAAYVVCVNFVGRKDSFHGSGCALNMTLLAINGAGKDTPRRAIEAVCNGLLARLHNATNEDNHGEMSRLSECVKECYPVNPKFGATQLVKNLLRRTSGVMVQSEAGIASNSNSGDLPMLRAGLMQMTSQGAHSRANFTEAKENQGLQPFGVNLSVFRESTKEAEMQHMDELKVESGEVARGVTITVDVSKQPDASKVAAGGQIPNNILDGFERLVAEQFRGEDLALNGKDEPGLSSVPCSHMDRPFKADLPVAQEFSQLALARTNMRRANTDNTADLHWAHGVRYQMVLTRYCLLLARTDSTAYHRQPVVTMQHYADAKAFLDECRRCELANSIDYGNDFDRLKEQMHETMKRLLDNPAEDLPKGYSDSIVLAPGSAKTALSRSMAAGVAHTQRKFPIAFFVQGRCKKSHKAMNALRNNESGRFNGMGPKRIYDLILEDGEGSLWHLSSEGYAHAILPSS